MGSRTQLNPKCAALNWARSRARTAWPCEGSLLSRCRPVPRPPFAGLSLSRRSVVHRRGAPGHCLPEAPTRAEIISRSAISLGRRGAVDLQRPRDGSRASRYTPETLPHDPLVKRRRIWITTATRSRRAMRVEGVRFVNDGAGNFTDRRLPADETDSLGALQDLNGDGKDDWPGGGPEEPPLRSSERCASGFIRSSPRRRLADPTTVEFVTEPDGGIKTSRSSDRAVWTLRNRGDGRFRRCRFRSALPGLTQMQGDFRSRRGWLCLVGNRSISARPFRRPEVMAEGPPVWSRCGAAGDFDGDGRPGSAVANATRARGLLLNQGGGIPTPAATRGGGVGPMGTAG
jgi:hypothetical protein